MSEELKSRIVTVHEKIWNERKLELCDTIYAEDFVRHLPPFPDIVGREALKASISDFLTAFPDFKVTFHEVIVEGDSGASRFTGTGTHTGHSSMLGIPPTGKHIAFSGLSIAHFVDGKAVEEWMNSDWLGLLQQLGVIPSPG